MTQTVERTWLIEARKRLGLSQEDLARRAGCSQNELSKIETGERKRPNPQFAEGLARVLNMTRDEVVYGSPQRRIVRILGEMLEDELVSMYSSEELLEIDWLTSEEMEGYRVASDTLEPRFSRGDILLCRRETTALGECSRRECVVELEGQRYVKHVEPGASLRLVTLRSYRAGNLTLVDKTPKWIAPILAIIPAAALGTGLEPGLPESA